MMCVIYVEASLFFEDWARSNCALTFTIPGKLRSSICCHPSRSPPAWHSRDSPSCRRPQREGELPHLLDTTSGHAPNRHIHILNVHVSNSPRSFSELREQIRTTCTFNATERSGRHPSYLFKTRRSDLGCLLLFLVHALNNSKSLQHVYCTLCLTTQAMDVCASAKRLPPL